MVTAVRQTDYKSHIGMVTAVRQTYYNTHRDGNSCKTDRLKHIGMLRVV